MDVSIWVAPLRTTGGLTGDPPECAGMLWNPPAGARALRRRRHLARLSLAAAVARLLKNESLPPPPLLPILETGGLGVWQEAVGPRTRSAPSDRCSRPNRVR